MSSDTEWRIHITDLETCIAVGIYPQEKEPQRVLVNAVIEGMYPARPQSVSECFNYELVHARVTREWLKRPHTDLLETLVTDLLEYIFRSSASVKSATVRLTKPDIFPDAKGVGVEGRWTRGDYERLCHGR